MMPNMSNNDFFKYLLMSGGHPGGFSQAASVGPDATAFQPKIDSQLQAQVGRPPAAMPQPRPAMAAKPPQQPAPPMSLAPPNPGPGMSFSGDKGPQWTDAQWQNHWNRSNPDGLMSYYPVQE